MALSKPRTDSVEKTRPRIDKAQPKNKPEAKPAIKTLPAPKSATKPAIKTLPAPKSATKPAIKTLPAPKSATKPAIKTLPAPKSATKPALNGTPSPKRAMPKKETPAEKDWVNMKTGKLGNIATGRKGFASAPSAAKRMIETIQQDKRAVPSVIKEKAAKEVARKATVSKMKKLGGR